MLWRRVARQPREHAKLRGGQQVVAQCASRVGGRRLDELRLERLHTAAVVRIPATRRV